MKKMLLGMVFLLLVIAGPIPAMAQVSISVGISLPPPIVFPAPPAVVVLPDTDDVYVVPDIDVEIFFWNGFWWRLWEGRWYRSRYYDRSWAYFDSVPVFYYEIDPGWRVYYREHNWHGHRWYYKRIPNRQLQRNWRGWHTNRYWERQGRTWGVQGYQPRPPQQRQEMRQHREMQYQRRPDVQRHEQERRERQMQPRGQEPGRPPEPRERQPRVQEPQRPPQRMEQPQQPRMQEPQRPPQRMEQPRQPRMQEPQGGEPRPQPQGRPESGGGEHGR